MLKLRSCLFALLLVVAVATDALPFCFDEAGAEYGINPQILRAIAKVESNFNPRAVNRNANGTYDFGLMQINSSWASTLGLKRWNNLGDACYNTKTGAWILAQCMSKYGYTWKAIGCYNSQTPTKRDVYARRVFEQLQRVKPLEQEAAYTPLKDNVEELIKEKVDGWVESAAQGKKAVFVARGRAFVPVPKEVLQQPPSLTDASLQSALPPQATTASTDTPAASQEDQQAVSTPATTPGVMP